jgi:Big-like domain-containing protein
MDGDAVLGTAPLAGMTAGLTTSALGAGAHTITGVYSGDANYAGAASASIGEDIV